MLTSFVDEPSRVTPTRWTAGAATSITGGSATRCAFNLFDRTPYAWRKVAKWADQREEFVKRAAFALLWGLTVHDKHADDAPFTEGLRLVERAATDERHLVKKAVNMALRAVGKRNARSTPPRWRWRASWPTRRRPRRGGWGRMRSGNSPVRR